MTKGRRGPLVFMGVLLLLLLVLKLVFEQRVLNILIMGRLSSSIPISSPLVDETKTAKQPEEEPITRNKKFSVTRKITTDKNTNVTTTTISRVQNLRIAMAGDSL
jgi:hypothetical protein